MIYGELLNGIKSKKAFVIGDVILDCNILGEFTHKSAETNISVFKESTVKYVVGGAGNVALNLISANQKVKFCSVLGNDNYGVILKDLLIDKGIDTSLCVFDDGRKTTVKKRYFVGDSQVFRSDNEDSFDISISVENAIINVCQREIPLCDIVVVSDYAKGVITYSLIEKIVKIANESGVKVIVDPKTENYSKYKNCSYIKPNLKEFSEMVKYGGYNEVSASSAVKICKENGNDGMIVTLGKNGMFAVDNVGNEYNVDGVKCDVIDVCGAGDTALAYATVGLLNEFDLLKVITIANNASSAKLSKSGATSVSLNEVFYPLGKVVEFDKVNLLKNAVKGKKVVFTNGCFDIFHKGHVLSLKKASEFGDVLVVGVNSDESVKRLKGGNRPFVSLDGRVEVLSALSCVDYVIPFSQDTPYELIKALEPSVLVKGSEYKDCGVVGQDIVEDLGGKVEYIDMEKGYSTTAIVNKIYESKK